MKSMQEYADNYEKSEEVNYASQPISHSYNLPQVANNPSTAINQNSYINNSEMQRYREVILEQEAQIKDYDLKFEVILTELWNSNVRINNLENINKELRNYKNETNTRLKEQEDEIKELRKELDTKIAKFTALASCTKLVEGMKVDYTTYSGPVQDGLPHGEGELVGMWGIVYKGTWVYGKREGLHVGEDKDETVYEYNYKDARQHGYQKTTYKDGRVDEENFKEGKYHGFQKKTNSDGKVFQWNYKNGRQHGYQKTTDSEGRICECNYKDDHLHGYQKTTFSDGRVCECNYKDWKRNGEFKIYYPNGKVEIKYYENGKLIL